MELPKLFKILDSEGRACNGGKGKWHLPHGGKPGRWMTKVKGELEMCRNGYHAVEASQIPAWLVADARIFECELSVEYIGPEEGKYCGRSARLVKELNWNDCIARLCACDFAERALGKIDQPDPHAVNAVQVARRYAYGEATEEELDAAWAAAWDEAWATAWDAACDEARAAAWAAARDAAWAAAGAAAWDEEYKWQGQQITKYLYGELP